MEEEEFKIVESILRGFGFKQIQLGRDVWQTAVNAGISFETLKDYISTIIERNVVGKERLLADAKASQAAIEALYPPCPECGSSFIPMRITLPEGPGNLYGYTIRWFCPHCMHEEFTKEDFDLVMTELKEKAEG